MTTRTLGAAQQDADINAAVAWIVANALTGGVLNQDVISAQVSGLITAGSVQLISGWTTVTHTYTIQAGSAAVGGFGSDQSFRPAITQAGGTALFYNSSNGAAITGTFSSDGVIHNSVSLVTLKYLQVQATNGYGYAYRSDAGIATGQDETIDSCIFEANGGGSGTNPAERD